MRLSPEESLVLHAAAGMDLFWPLRDLSHTTYDASGRLIRTHEEALLVTYNNATNHLKALGLIEYCGTSHIKITP